MPIFRVNLNDSKFFFDGVHRHEPGALVRIEKKDYDRLLNADFEPQDAEGRKDMEEFRDKRSKILGKPVTPQAKTIGTLDPNKPGELAQITSGVEVVKPGVPANVVDFERAVAERVTIEMNKAAASKK